MGFLDKAKKLAEQAKDKAEEALDEVKSRTEAAREASPSPSSSSGPPPGQPDPRMGTPYHPGMLGRPGWREQGLVDPAAVLPVTERDRFGVPHSTKSQILEEPYGMGRRWSSGGRSAALFYQLYPEHQSWEPPGGTTPLPDVGGAAAATLPDGRSLVFIANDGRRVVLELNGLDDTARSQLARTVAEQLASA